jgi:hypothetical protein
MMTGREAAIFEHFDVAWWSSALTPSREDARSIPNPGNPIPTLGIGASPLFRNLAGSFCSILKNGSIGSEKSDTLQKLVAEQPEPDPKKKNTLMRDKSDYDRQRCCNI